MAKNPKLTPEESRAARLALTAGVASMSHFGIQPPSASPLLPLSKPAEPEAATVPALPEPATGKVAGSAGASTPAPLQEEQKGEKDGVGEGQPAPGPAAALDVAPEPVPVQPAVEVAAGEPDATQADLDESSDGEQSPAADVTGPELATTGTYDFKSVFASPKVKKSILIRITQEHHEFFVNLGLVLGSGASAPDIIHNIMSQWREANDAPIQKAMQKRLRQLITKKP